MFEVKIEIRPTDFQGWCVSVGDLINIKHTFMLLKTENVR